MVSFLQQVSRFVRRKRDPAPGSQARSAAPAAPGGGQLVLVVDLDGRTGQPLAQSLEHAGFQPYVVQRDGAALELLGQAAPAVVIVVGPADVNFYRALRRATPAPLLGLDPRADDEQVLAAFAAGVDQFQTGPIGYDEVVARVQALLRRVV